MRILNIIDHSEDPNAFSPYFTRHHSDIFYYLQDGHFASFAESKLLPMENWLIFSISYRIQNRFSLIAELAIFKCKF